MESDQIDVVEYPRLNLGGVSYPVKLTTWAALLMEREGISLAGIDPGKYPMERALKMLAACMSTPAKTFSVDELAQLIPFEDLPAAFRTLSQALSKAAPQAARTAEPLPAASLQ